MTEREPHVRGPGLIKGLLVLPYDSSMAACVLNVDEAQGEFIRVQETLPNERGGFSGVFGIVNRLAERGELSCEEERFRRVSNQWLDAAYPDPSETDPTVYDHDLNPHAAAWFKATATHLLERVDGYLRILDRHGIGYEIMQTDDPGRVVYEDDYQVVAVPAWARGR